MSSHARRVIAARPRLTSSSAASTNRDAVKLCRGLDVVTPRLALAAGTVVDRLDLLRQTMSGSLSASQCRRLPMLARTRDVPGAIPGMRLA